MPAKEQKGFPLIFLEFWEIPDGNRLRNVWNIMIQPIVSAIDKLWVITKYKHGLES